MKHTCDNHHSIDANQYDRREAAQIFAERKARAEFGPGGHVRALRCDAITTDGICAEYEAFIGYSPRGESHTIGHNVRFNVYTD